jgi:hypothetical protein
LLAELASTDYKIQLDVAEAEYQGIKAEAERLMALYKENVTTPNVNDKAVYGLRQITVKYTSKIKCAEASFQFARDVYGRYAGSGNQFSGSRIYSQ